MILDAVIIGAGPSGLAAAESLLRGGARVTLLEAGSQVGGMARSHRVGDHLCDLGPHRLHVEASPRVKALLGGKAGLSERRRSGCLHVGRREVDYPLSPISTLRSLGPCRAAKMFAGALGACASPGDGSYVGEAVRRVGRPIYELLYAPAAEKIWGRDPSELDPEQARARVSASGPLSLLGRLCGRGEPGHYLYPTAGANSIAYDAWADRLVDRGLTLVRGARAEHIERDHGRASAVRASVDGCSQRFEGSRVISTLSLPRMLDMVDPGLGRAHRAGLQFRSVVVLQIALNIPRLTDKDVHYFPQREVPFARLTEQSAFGRTADAPRGETVVSLDFYDERGGRVARASADELLAQALPHLAVFGVTQEQVVAVERVVCDDAYPVLARDFQRARAHCLDAAATVEGLVTTGRAGLFLHVNQHHAIEMGLQAGECALGQSVAARWRTQARGFEGLRIVD